MVVRVRASARTGTLMMTPRYCSLIRPGFYGLFAIAMFLNTVGCNDPFSPKGPYEERLAIYSVLSSSERALFARVFTTYDPVGYDPLENTSDTQIPDATVTLTLHGVNYGFRDTVIVRPDQSRYTDDIHAYVLDSFPFRSGETYALYVLVPDGRSIISTVVVPSHGYIRINNGYVFTNPGRHDDDISITASISQVTRGFVIRAFVEYEVLEGGLWVLHRSEIPSGIDADPDEGEDDFVYPTLTRRLSVPLPGSGNPGVESTVFAHAAYYALINRIGQQYGGSLRYTRIVVTLVQAEINLYNYFNIANGFRDQYTIRLDQPDYSNVEGGVGIFGAMVSDSAFVDLPPNIIL